MLSRFRASPPRPARAAGWCLPREGFRKLSWIVGKRPNASFPFPCGELPPLPSDSRKCCWSGLSRADSAIPWRNRSLRQLPACARIPSIPTHAHGSDMPLTEFVVGHGTRGNRSKQHSCGVKRRSTTFPIFVGNAPVAGVTEMQRRELRITHPDTVAGDQGLLTTMEGF